MNPNAIELAIKDLDETKAAHAKELAHKENAITAAIGDVFVKGAKVQGPSRKVKAEDGTTGTVPGAIYTVYGVAEQTVLVSGKGGSIKPFGYDKLTLVK